MAEEEGRGEILARGSTVVSQRPAAGGGRVKTQSPYLDEEGWLHTGDLGHFDAEGDLWVTGRASERIVTGGVTVEPGEIEATLLHHPDVNEIAIVGSPDAEWGERVVAVVVPAVADRPPTLPQLLEFTRSRLGPAKRPRELRIVESLPRTSNGKLDRLRLRDL